jgi:hypothetical protein
MTRQWSVLQDPISDLGIIDDDLLAALADALDGPRRGEVVAFIDAAIAQQVATHGLNEDGSWAGDWETADIVRDALVALDVLAVRAWASEWPSCCGVMLQPGGKRVNVWHRDPDTDDGVLDHLHQETLRDDVAEAAGRLITAAAVVRAAGYGFSDGTFGRLVIRIPDA